MKIFDKTAAAVALAGAVGLAASAPASAETYVSIGTAKATGSWYPLGAALSTVVSKHAAGVTAKVESTKGGMANVHLLAKKQVDVAFVPPWAIADARKGAGDYKGKKGFPVKVSGWLGFAPNYLTVMVPADSAIKSVNDLRGKRVNMGAPGTFNRPILRMVLNEQGIAVKDVKAFDIALGPAVNRLKNRQLDVVWWWAATPASAFTDASVSLNTRLVGLNPASVKQLTGKYSWFSAGSIPAGTYKGTAQATPTVFTKISAAILSSVPDEVAYKMTKAVFENLKELGAIHPVFKKLSKANVLEGLSIPIHPGAEKYFREVGVPGLDAFVKKMAKN